MSLRPKLFRDPVHDLITLDPARTAEAMVLALLGTPEVQRLRRVRQLALANLVYHGAEHSRFSHSLGVMHLAKRALDVLGRQTEVGTGDRCATLAAAMLHDIGHGPFSHAIEKTTQVRHELISRALILDPETEVCQVLTAVDPSLPDRVANLVHPLAEQQRGYASDLVSSQLDADRMDYILRDGHATGVKIGVYDLERILSMMEITEDGRLAIGVRAKEAVEGYLLARLHMYKQVYLHKAVRAGEMMLVAAFKRASELLQGGVPLEVPRSGLATMLRGAKLGHRRFTQLDDSDVWVALKAWSRCRDDVLAELASGLVHRRLYKTRMLGDDTSRHAEAIDAARRAITKAGGDGDYHLLEDRASDTPYRPYIPGKRANQRPILIASDSGLQPIEDVSRLAQLLGDVSYSVVRLVFPGRFRGTVEAAVASIESV